ncbi:MAG: argininosuccinate synthase [Chloroflexota bacterium]
MNWKDLQKSGSSVFAGALSGGLDSCTITHWLADKGIKVHAFTVDIGQPDEEDINSIAERMKGCGAYKVDILDAKDVLAQSALKLLQSQARYEGGYWNTTGIARPVIVSTILNAMAESKIKVFFHGATGRGNDQVRFELAANMLDPSVSVYAPWRDPEFLESFPGRQSMIDYCESNGLPIKTRSESRYSTDANFVGLSHEAGDLEDVSIPSDFVTPVMGVTPEDAPITAETVSIEWAQGIPIKIDSKPLNLTEMFVECNKIGGRNGIGINTHAVENRFVGIKSRGIYEAPGIEVLGQSLEYLLQFILDRRAREFYEQVSAVVSRQLYQGYWLDLATTAALSSLDPIMRLVNGTIKVSLYKGNVLFDSAATGASEMPHSLYTDDSSMEAIGNYDHLDAEGLLKIYGLSAKNFGNSQYKSTGR